MKRKYLWIRDLPDRRDFKYQRRLVTLPDRVDLRPEMPPIVDQLDLGSCTANACSSNIHYLYQKQTDTGGDWEPSRLFIYYNTRQIEGTTEYDAGATIRNTIKSRISDCNILQGFFIGSKRQTSD